MRRLLHIRLENIANHADLTIDLSGVDAGAIVGPNGAGKTTIFRAIRWALYGDADADALLRDHTDRSRVTLEVEQSGSRWRVIRTRQRGKSSTLTLERRDGTDWRSLTQRTIAETQRRIDTLLTGMTADQHYATMYAAQGECGHLASLRPGERKDLLGSLLGLSQWETWRSTASAHHRALESQLVLLDANVAQLQQQHDDLAAAMPDEVALTAARDAANERVERANAGVDTAIAAQKTRADVELRERLGQQMTGLRARKERSLAVEARRVDLAEVLAGADGVRARFKTLDEHRRRYDADMAAHAVRERSARDARDATQDRLARAESAATAATRDAQQRSEALTRARAERALFDADPDPTCPTCEQHLPDQARAAARRTLDAQIAALEANVADVTTTRENADRELEAARLALDNTPVSIATPSMNGHDPQEWEVARHNVEQIDRLTGEHASLHGEDLAALEAEFLALRDERRKLPREAPDAQSVADARAEVTAATAALRDLEAQVTRYTSQRDTLNGLAKQITKQSADRPELAAAIEAWAVLTRACSREGVPALILDNAVGDIEANANDTLEQLGSPLRVALETQRTTKSDTIAETLDITVSDGGEFHPLARYGGGQRYRVHLALRIGLARAIAGRGGPSCEVLLIDEITDLDEEGKTSLGPVLAAWPGQVLLISHDDQLSNALPTRVQVTPTPGHQPSRVEVT